MTSASHNPDWAISLGNAQTGFFSTQNHQFVAVEGFMTRPEVAIEDAILQKFAIITPQYPGVRAPLAGAVCAAWLDALAPMLSAVFGPPQTRWEMQAWYSLVTTPARDLAPIQCFPHVDGTDPAQIAMMLYLHTNAPGCAHGGTAFFRHHSTGLEALTAETFPAYRSALAADVARSGLPQPAYPTTGAPHFAPIHASSGAFNSAVFYRGNILHSGVIDNAAALPADPRRGRLTINAFFRPI